MMKNYILLVIFMLLPLVWQCSTFQSKTSEGDKEKSSNIELVAVVQKNNQWFFINEKNEKLFNQHFTMASQFNDGISCVSKDSIALVRKLNKAHYYAINTKGDKIDEIHSDLPFMFSEERAIVTKGDSAYLIDTQGKILKAIINIEGFLPYQDERAIIRHNNQLQIWDKNGNVVQDNLTFTFRQVSENHIAFNQFGKFGYTDRDGHVLQEPIYANAFNFQEGLARIQEKDGQWYYINTNFEKVLGPFQNGRGAQENLIAIQQDGLWQFIDKKGNLAIEEKFAEADSFFEGLAIVINQDQKVGFINKEGEFTPIDARVAYGFHNGLAIAEKGDKMGFINTQGEWTIPATYERVNNFNKLK